MQVKLHHSTNIYVGPNVVTGPNLQTGSQFANWASDLQITLDGLICKLDACRRPICRSDAIQGRPFTRVLEHATNPTPPTISKGVLETLRDVFETLRDGLEHACFTRVLEHAQFANWGTQFADWVRSANWDQHI